MFIVIFALNLLYFIKIIMKKPLCILTDVFDNKLFLLNDELLA